MSTLLNAKLTVATDAQNCAAVALNFSTPAKIFIPGNAIGSALTFAESCVITGPYSPLGDGSGNTYTVNYVAGQAVPLDPTMFAGSRFIKPVFTTPQIVNLNCDILAIDR